MYRYYMVARPAGPGAQPKEGLVNIIELDPSRNISALNGPAYAVLEYDRPLSLQEERSYELVPDLYEADVHYRGYVFRWEMRRRLWRICEESDPQMVLACEETLKACKADIDEYLATTEKEG